MTEAYEAVVEDVAALDRLDRPLGLVSNNQHATTEFLLAYPDLPAFETASGRRPTLAGVAECKPEPDLRTLVERVIPPERRIQ